MDGTVKWFNRDKGYGFISGEDEKDYFFHYTSVPDGTVLKEGDKVTFEPFNAERGLQAKNIKKGKEKKNE